MCSSARTCHDAFSKHQPSPSTFHGVEFPLWDVPSEMFWKDDLVSQIIGFSGSAWNPIDRNPFNKSQASHLCRFLHHKKVLREAGRCLIGDEEENSLPSGAELLRSRKRKEEMCLGMNLTLDCSKRSNEKRPLRLANPKQLQALRKKSFQQFRRRN